MYKLFSSPLFLKLVRLLAAQKEKKSSSQIHVFCEIKKRNWLKRTGVDCDSLIQIYFVVLSCFVFLVPKLRPLLYLHISHLSHQL